MDGSSHHWTHSFGSLGLQFDQYPRFEMNQGHISQLDSLCFAFSFLSSTALWTVGFSAQCFAQSMKAGSTTSSSSSSSWTQKVVFKRLEEKENPQNPVVSHHVSICFLWKLPFGGKPHFWTNPHDIYLCLAMGQEWSTTIDHSWQLLWTNMKPSISGGQ